MRMSKLSRALITVVVIIAVHGCKESAHPLLPSENRFKKVIVAQGKDALQGAIEFDFAPDGRIYLVHLTGQLKIFNPQTKTFTVAGKFDGGEYGLIGLKLDPHFEKNNFIYLQYFTRDTTRYADSLRRRTMRISRFTVVNDSIDRASEKNYLKIPYEHECCHTGGGMDFDEKGNLYISTGDNTGAFFTQYAPTVFLEGHLIDDGLRSAGNTNDYRGKILRIHPEPDGTYTIPDGNLFGKDASGAKPEIFVMGVRNPYRLTIDNETGYLLWGEVGPDAGRDSVLGPRGYDEFNVTGKAGNFGWPLVIANNKPYTQVTYSKKEEAAALNVPYTIKGKMDTAKLVNFSPHNTGFTELPPSTPAFIWYPYDSSDVFPSLGKGGRTAICGPVYQYDPELSSAVKFPEYFDHCWFIADWMRDWIKIVHFGKNNQLQRIEDFLPGKLFTKPVCMHFGPDGALYVLEYGSTWADNNEDVQLSRIEYISGNLPPTASIERTGIADSNSMTISLNAENSYDEDGDALQYLWRDDKGNTVRHKRFSVTYNEAGKYKISLEVKDEHGGVSIKDTSFLAGGMPLATFSIINRSFYKDSISYAFNITGVDPANAKVFLQAINKPGQNTSPKSVLSGEVLLNESDCKACHQHELKSVGPSFKQLADKYSTQIDMIPTLAAKIINGGSGVWGKNNMSAHPQLSVEQAKAIVQYIYSLNNQQEPARQVGLKGVIQPGNANQPSKMYKLAGEVTGATGDVFKDSILLRYVKINATAFDCISDASVGEEMIKGRTFSYVCLKNIDLSGVKQINVIASGPIDIRLDSEKGLLIGKTSAINGRGLQSITTAIQPVTGSHDLFFVFGVAKDGFILQQNLQQVSFELH